MPITIKESSPRVQDLPKFLIHMKPHQQAITYKCQQMENDYFEYMKQRIAKDNSEKQQMKKILEQKKRVAEQEEKNKKLQNPVDTSNWVDEFQPVFLKEVSAFGVIGTVVGSGKTLSIIGLAMFDKYKNQANKNNRLFTQNTSFATMIVVPSHLYYQWVEAFDKFVGDALKVELFDDYESIQKLYRGNTDMIKDADIYLVSALFYETVASSLSTMKMAFKRVVFDEIDSTGDLLHSLIPAGYTWLVSGSLKGELDKKEVFTFGSTEFKSKDLANNMIDCDETFIVNSFNIPPYDFKSITCDNPVLDVMKSVLEPEVLQCINACDPVTALMKMGLQAESNIKNDKQLANIIIKNWSTIIDQTIQYCKELEALLENLLKPEQKKKIKDELALKEKDIYDLTEKRNFLMKGMENIKAHDDRPKLITLSNLIVRNKGKKIILYAEYPRVFNDVAKFLDEYGIGYVDLEGGNNEAMNIAVHKFKTSDKINVILIHSTLFSCGMNLENATNIIFLHRVRTDVQKQVIGRGQRPGRTTSLDVTELLYKNEKALQLDII